MRALLAISRGERGREFSNLAHAWLFLQHGSNGTQVLQSCLLRRLPEVRRRHVLQKPGRTGKREFKREFSAKEENLRSRWQERNEYFSIPA